MSPYKQLDEAMKAFKEKYKYHLDEFGAHELRFSYGIAFSGVYSACFTFSFPRTGADKEHAKNFNKMLEDFRNSFNFEYCKSNGSHWADFRDSKCYNFINPKQKFTEILCSFDGIEWVSVDELKNKLENDSTKTDIHIKYITNKSHKDILTEINIVDIIRQSVNEKFGYSEYLNDVDEKEIINSISKIFNTCESNIKTVDFEKTVSSEYFLINF